MRRLFATLGAALSAAALLTNLTVALPAADGGAASIAAPELREWLSYLASDELQGRAVFSEGFGLAGGYIADHLRAWGVKPAGDPGQYLQTVRVLGVKTTSHSTVTVTVGGESKTFADGDGVTFPKNMGSNQTLTVDRVEFAGYGLDAPGTAHADYRGKNIKGAAVVWLGASGPEGLDSSAYRRALTGRSRYATEQLGAAAAIGPVGSGGAGRGGAGRAGGAGEAGTVDFTTAQRLDVPIAPTVVGSDAFFEFLFSAAPVKYSDLKRRAAGQAALPSFRLTGVTLTFHIDADYRVVRTQLTHNVVGMIEGSDAQLKSTFVAFGAHYDHVGYAEGDAARGDGGGRRGGAPRTIGFGTAPTTMDPERWR